MSIALMLFQLFFKAGEVKVVQLAEREQLRQSTCENNTQDAVVCFEPVDHNVDQLTSRKIH